MRATAMKVMLGFVALGGVTQVYAKGDGAVTLTIENDVFTHSDNNYTNGLGIAWVSGAVRADDSGLVGRWTKFWSFLPFVADDRYTTYASWALAHEMNPPDDIRDPHPSANDQPYSGTMVGVDVCRHRRLCGRSLPAARRND